MDAIQPGINNIPTWHMNEGSTPLQPAHFALAELAGAEYRHLVATLQ